MNSLTFLTLHLLTFVFPICFSSSYSNPKWYDSCAKNFTCGDFTVGFPFWGGSVRPKECGYPELQLTCEDDNKPAIQIANMKFYVMEINQTSKILRIAREDLTKGICLQKFENTTLDFKRFNYAPGTQNITVLYGCPLIDDGYGTTTSYNGQFTCRITGVTSNIGGYQSGDTGPTGCYASVTVPVLGSSEILLSKSSISLPEVLDKGFEVYYKEPNVDETICTQCELSKGHCVFDVSKNASTCVCPDGSSGYTSCSLKTQISPNSGKKKRMKLSIVLSAFFTATGLCILLILLIYVKKRGSSDNRGVGTTRQERNVDVEAFLRHQGSAGLKRYTYNDLKKITNSFKDKLGEGGYGLVYKGQLQNGNLVAVKMLHKQKVNTGEFINEVASIGNTNHVNIVKLFGVCYEGHRRALVYELMVNGSLEKFLRTGNNHHSLGLETLFKISIGVARGLEYLHRGCNTRILHFDIKPHNILLDENFCPKISDFGLAKSCPQKDSIVLSMSEARGTVGYIAPEVFLKGFGGVSYKSDVYSYGMLILEMVGCRRKADIECELSSEQYFPQWIYKQLEGGKEPNQEGIVSSEDIELQRKMIVVSLWCVKTNPSSRPAMSKVVEMLEGTSELQIPPASSLSLSSSLRSQH